MESEADKWAKEAFAQATKDSFGFSMADIEQIIETSLSMKENEQLVGYFEGFLGFESAFSFVQELQKKREKLQSQPVKGVWQTNQLDIVQLIQRQLGVDETVANETLSVLKSIVSDEERQDYLENLIGKGFESQRILILLAKQMKKEQDEKQKEKAVNASKASKAKKKRNIAKIALEKVGDKAWCECLATVHDFVCNCLHCGKILCALEGDLICSFCGKVPQEGLVDLPSGFETAASRTKTLLEYQASSAKRTHVHDNAADFDVGADQYNKWLTAEERAVAVRRLQEQEREEEEAKTRRVITLDLENHRVLVEKPAKVLSLSTQNNANNAEASSPNDSATEKKGTGVFRNPTLKDRKAIFVPFANESNKKTKKPSVNVDWDVARLQDEDR